MHSSYIKYIKYIKYISCIALLTWVANSYSQSNIHWILGAHKALDFHGEPSPKNYYISIGIFQDKNNAEQLFGKLKAWHIPSVHFGPKKEFYRVYVGPIKSAEEVRAVGRQLMNPPSNIKPKQSTQQIATARFPRPSSIEIQPGSNASLASSPSSGWSWVGTISADLLWEHEGETQTFYLVPGVEKTYAADQSTNTLFAGEVFLGGQKRLFKALQGQFGLAVAATSNAKLSGHIWDDADPEFDDYTYTYTLQHTHVAVKGKLLADSGFGLDPWASASIGIGFNSAHGFNNTPLLFEALPDANFSNHTQTMLIYTLGAGIQKPINEHWQFGIGYEVADWGKSHLGRAEGQTLNSGLNLGHFHTRGVLFNLTYLPGNTEK